MLNDNQIETTEATEELEVVESSLSTQLSEEVVTMLLNNVEKLETAGPGVQVDSESFKFTTIGQSVKGVFAGYQQMTFKVEDFDPKNPIYTTQKAIKWVNKGTDGKIKFYVCASKALVNKIQENNISVGSLLEITMTDDKGGNNKKVKLFNVAVLNATK